MENANIIQRMGKIQAGLQTVAKNLAVVTGKDKNGREKSYKAVSERDILDAVKPMEEKHGVYSYPISRELIKSEILESAGYDGKTKSTFYSIVKTVYRFVNADNPAEYIDMTTFSEGIDAGDKGFGKAMTYGDKYALMKAYKISTGDDPDENASQETTYASKNAFDAVKSLLWARIKKNGLDYKDVFKSCEIADLTPLNAKKVSEYLDEYERTHKDNK